MNVFWVLNSHSHVMYILSIVLTKHSEVKVSLKPRKTTAYTKLSTNKVRRLIQCILSHYTLWKYYLYDKNIHQCDLKHLVSSGIWSGTWHLVPGLTSGLQGSVNVHRGALLLVPQWQCISSLVFYIQTMAYYRSLINRFTWNSAYYF